MSRWLLLLPVCAILLASCGADPPTTAEAAPFKTALEAQLKKIKSEMVVESFESIQISGSTATAKVRLSHESTGMNPLWTVKYKKSGDKWEYESRD